MLIVAFYLNSMVLVPRFLLRNHKLGYYFLIIIAIVVVIVFLTGWIDRFLNLHQLFDAAFHKNWQRIDPGRHHGPPKPGGGNSGEV